MLIELNQILGPDITTISKCQAEHKESFNEICQFFKFPNKQNPQIKAKQTGFMEFASESASFWQIIWLAWLTTIDSWDTTVAKDLLIYFNSDNLKLAY